MNENQTFANKVTNIKSNFRDKKLNNNSHLIQKAFII